MRVWITPAAFGGGLNGGGALGVDLLQGPFRGIHPREDDRSDFTQSAIKRCIPRPLACGEETP